MRVLKHARNVIFIEEKSENLFVRFFRRCLQLLSVLYALSVLLYYYDFDAI